MSSYRTFDELARGAAARVELTQLLSKVAVSMPVAASVRTHLIRMGDADSLTLGAFLGRADLHRRLKSIIPLSALIRAIEEYLSGYVPAAPKPEPIRELEVRAHDEARVLVTREALRLVVDPLGILAAMTPGQGAQTVTQLDGLVRRFAHRNFEREIDSARVLMAGLQLPASREFSWPVREHLALIREFGLDEARWGAQAPRFREPITRGSLRLRATERRGWVDVDGSISVGDVELPLHRFIGTAAPSPEPSAAARSAVNSSESADAARSSVAVDGRGFDASNQFADSRSGAAHVSPRAAASQSAGASSASNSVTASRRSSRKSDQWFEIAPNDFVPFDDDLMHVLETLRRLSTAHGISAVAGPVLRSLGASVGVEPEHPLVAPADLRATLRPYQLEGFQWLARMAAMTQGAVLADDMGLGKTIQAIALLLHREKVGEALVVAPSSVVPTWVAALEQFAPTLVGRVEITSWSLLARSPQHFAGKHFATVVLDEAQSLKNADTQRAQAAFSLGAGFVVALTGTPIENHLGEAWSLFHATVPSLLGTESDFQRRYLDNAPASIAALAMVLKPFMLRRTKAAVAPELPPRTERSLTIELSLEERALIETIRREAALAAQTNTFTALAALTRLRLAACHPALVEPTWSGPTSKLTALRSLVSTLREEGHRVLIFSQFTKHLALVREALEADGVTLSYLDGSTPITERARAVQAFQGGEGGEVFLISLKAGGTGLTLTAADDVIHLDPWWNPAVEDQASDRAHRIGQTRPVTIYRLIAQGTVEEKMLVLHREKRALVDALLEGTDSTSRLSSAELLELLSPL